MATFGEGTALPRQQKVAAGLAEIWERFKEETVARLEPLDRAVVAAARGELTAELRELAIRQSHTLAGSVGSLGFVEGARLAREIEQCLLAEQSLSSPGRERLRAYERDRASADDGRDQNRGQHLHQAEAALVAPERHDACTVTRSIVCPAS